MRQNPVNAERVEKSDDTRTEQADWASGLAKENDCAMPTAFDRLAGVRTPPDHHGRSDAGSPVK